MVKVYAVQDRVPCLQLDDTIRGAEEVLKIPLKNLLPGPEDKKSLRRDLEVMVMRILCSNMASFKGLADRVDWHIKHRYSDESELRSEVIAVSEQKMCITFEMAL